MALSPDGGNGILTGVIAFVDVWASNRSENYSKMFSQQLLNLGAKVSKTFNKQVSHVIYKDGSQSTWDKAVKNKVKLVSVLWVEKCRETSVHVDESVYPAINTNNGLPQLTKKKRKCMQPKDFVERTPENDRRLARKFDKMCKDLEVQKASVDIPILLYDDDGTLLYSPKAVVEDRFNAMEKRLQEMKDKRENLSPTASQMSQTLDTSSPKPSLGYSPSILNPPHVNDSNLLDTSYEDLFQSVLKEDSVPSTPINNKVHVANKDTVNSIASGSGLLTPQKTEEVKFSPERVKRRSRPQAKSRKLNLFKLADGTNGGAALYTINDPVVDFTAPGSKATLNLSADAGNGECTNFSLQISPRDQKCNRKVEAAHNMTDSGSDVFSNTFPEKDRISGSEYSSMANRLIALCEEKKQSKKTERRSLKLEVRVPHAKNKAVKEEAKTCLSSRNIDSDDTCSQFEDFFTSLDVNTHQSKLTRFSLTNESRKSPSPPPLVINEIGSCKRSRSLGNALPETCTAKKRKTIHSLSHSDSSPLEHSRKGANLTRKESPVSGPETRVSKKKSDVSENGNPIQMTTVSPATCNKMQDVPGSQEILHLTTSNEDGKQMKLFQPSVGNKTSASDAIGGLSEMFNEQRNKCTEDSRKAEKSRKVTRSLVMTSMSAEKQSTVIQVVKKFGGFVFSDEVCETTSHVIAGSPRRTLNIILGIARGCWILSYDWVLWSLERGYWIPEKPYELSDHFPGAPMCRLQRHLSAGEYHQNLFSSVPAFFISPSSQPPCDKLSQAVQLSGGKVCKTLRQAKVCIGMLAGKKPLDLEFVSEKWLLDSITQHKLLPLQNYLLEQ